MGKRPRRFRRRSSLNSPERSKAVGRQSLPQLLMVETGAPVLHLDCHVEVAGLAIRNCQRVSLCLHRPSPNRDRPTNAVLREECVSNACVYIGAEQVLNLLHRCLRHRSIRPVGPVHSVCTSVTGRNLRRPSRTGSEAKGHGDGSRLVNRSLGGKFCINLPTLRALLEVGVDDQDGRARES